MQYQENHLHESYLTFQSFEAIIFFHGDVNEMQQTEMGRLTFEDRKELEYQIKLLSQKVEESVVEGLKPEFWEADAFELRRLRRLRNDYNNPTTSR